MRGGEYGDTRFLYTHFFSRPQQRKPKPLGGACQTTKAPGRFAGHCFFSEKRSQNGKRPGRKLPRQGEAHGARQ